MDENWLAISVSALTRRPNEFMLVSTLANPANVPHFRVFDPVSFVGDWLQTVDSMRNVHFLDLFLKFLLYNEKPLGIDEAVISDEMETVNSSIHLEIKIF
jgi:hypothetical protein